MSQSRVICNLLIGLSLVLWLNPVLAQKESVSAEDYNAHGNQLLRERQFERASKAYAKATELKPEDSHYHFKLGTTLYYLKDYRKALDSYDRAIELNPNNPMFLEMRAKLLMVLGLYYRAIEDCNKLIKNSQNVEYWTSQKAYLYYLMGSYEESVEIYKQLFRKHPEKLEYDLKLGECLLGMNKFDEAKIHFNMILSKQPGNNEALINRAIANLNSGEIKEACRDLKKLMKERVEQMSVYSLIENHCD